MRQNLLCRKHFGGRRGGRFFGLSRLRNFCVSGASLIELAGIGPYLEKIIRRWIEDPPPAPTPPAIRNGFLTTTQAQKALAKKPAWLGDLKGDLQMHSEWSDGSASVKEMAEAGEERGYECIAITDHA